MSGEDCLFCRPQRGILAENAHAIAVLDSYPVSPGHSLVLPRRHVVQVWELGAEEWAAAFELVRTLKPLLQERYRPDGFNIGVNCGEAGGQSVWHAHIHVMPRFKGDNPDPKGGVRNVIPLKAAYWRRAGSATSGAAVVSELRSSASDVPPSTPSSSGT